MVEFEDTYALSFDTPDAARTYVRRIAHYLRDVAMYIDGCDVIVLDGLNVQREPILRLARESGASHRIPIG